MRHRGESPRSCRERLQQRCRSDRSGHWSGSRWSQRTFSGLRSASIGSKNVSGTEKKPKGPSRLEEHRRDRQMRGCGALHRNWGHRPVRLYREARGLRRPGSSSRTERRSGLQKRDKQKGKPLYPVCPIRMRDCCNPRWEGSPCRTTLRSVEGKGKAPEGPEVTCMLWARGDRLRLLVQRRAVRPPARSG